MCVNYSFELVPVKRAPATSNCWLFLNKNPVKQDFFGLTVVVCAMARNRIVLLVFVVFALPFVAYNLLSFLYYNMW